MEKTENFSLTAKDYKRTYAGKFMLVEGARLMENISGEDFCVTKKMDGIMQVVFVRDGKVCAYTSHGNQVPSSLPCITEFAALVAASGIMNATFGAELYATIRTDGRERVCDVTTALSKPELLGQLHLAPFDIIDLDGKPFEAEHYKEKMRALQRIFGKGVLVMPVDSRSAASKHEVNQIFDEWVTKGGAEGLVIHSEMPVIYKVKPRHTVDAVIIGYTVGEDIHADMVRDILLAVMRPDGLLQQFATTGSGFTEEQRQSLYAELLNDSAESEYIETDSRNVAFQMVRPRIVVEISALDFVTENAAGEPKRNMLISYSEESGYKVVMQADGVAAHNPVFVRVRDDKSFCESDIRVRQLKDLCSFAIRRVTNAAELPESTVLLRRVFVKQSSGRMMVQKFVVWKTNKEQTGMFPAYVFHNTDYSSSRCESLKRDIRVSDSREQIMELCNDYIESVIKKGWSEL